MLNSVIFSNTLVSSAGAITQPSRQPVIDQLFENELTITTGSSGPASVTSDGAWRTPYAIRA